MKFHHHFVITFVNDEVSIKSENYLDASKKRIHTIYSSRITDKQKKNRITIIAHEFTPTTCLRICRCEKKLLFCYVVLIFLTLFFFFVVKTNNFEGVSSLSLFTKLKKYIIVLPEILGVPRPETFAEIISDRLSFWSSASKSIEESSLWLEAPSEPTSEMKIKALTRIRFYCLRRTKQLFNLPSPSWDEQQVLIVFACEEGGSTHESTFINVSQTWFSIILQTSPCKTYNYQSRSNMWANYTVLSNFKNVNNESLTCSSVRRPNMPISLSSSKVNTRTVSKSRLLAVLTWKFIWLSKSEFLFSSSFPPAKTDEATAAADCFVLLTKHSHT